VRLYHPALAEVRLRTVQEPAAFATVADLAQVVEASQAATEPGVAELVGLVRARLEHRFRHEVAVSRSLPAADPSGIALAEGSRHARRERPIDDATPG
jgi:hypothetical protein